MRILLLSRRLTCLYDSLQRHDLYFAFVSIPFKGFDTFNLLTVPQASIKIEIQMLGLISFNTMLDGTSKIAYGKK